MSSDTSLPQVIADLPLDETTSDLLRGRVQLRPWSDLQANDLDEVHGLFTFGHPRVDATTIDRLPALRVIANYGVGVDHIDVAAASARGVPVGNTPGVLEGATADLGFALLLALARKVVEGDRYARSTEFTSYDPGFMVGREVHGTTLGIVGLGTIGRLVARRALGFDMTVLYHNRNRRPEAEAELNAEYTSLDDLLGRSDYVMLCVPLTEETRGRIGSRELARMKPSAFLVNIARGAVVKTDDLAAALAARTIAGAALDVTDPEPLPRDHPLLGMANVVITPHLGSASAETRRRMAENAVANLLAGLSGDPLPWRVG